VRGSNIWREKSAFQSIRRNVTSTRVSRSRRPNSCAFKKATTRRAPFYHVVSRAFFAERADISKRDIIVPIAQRFGISASDVEAAWRDRRFSPTVDGFVEEAHVAGATGVPAMGWPHRRAIVGMMPATELVRRLRNEAR
jgi:predicted DsbA family dithiol-disulfide isomerase